MISGVESAVWGPCLDWRFLLDGSVIDLRIPVIETLQYQFDRLFVSFD